jgi:uncharacterized protein (TIGR02246 family)
MKLFVLRTVVGSDAVGRGSEAVDKFQCIPRTSFICGLPILMNYARMESSAKTRTSRQYYDPLNQTNNESAAFTSLSGLTRESATSNSPAIIVKRTTLIRSSSILPLALTGAMGCGTSSARAAESNPQEEAAITKMAEAFVEAFQKGDAKAVAAFWTPDGDYVDATGRVLIGRPAIEKDFEKLFAEKKGLKLRIEVASLKFPTPDTAVEDGSTGVLAPDGTVPSRARYTNFFTKKNGQWLLASVREAA